MAAILNSAILNLAILDSAILIFFSQTQSYLPRLVSTICTKKKIHSHFPPHHLHKKKLHSFILTELIWWQPSWILPSWILPSWIQLLHLWNSDTWLSSLRFSQKHSPSTLTLTQTNSIWFKLIHSHLTWWWWPSWILPSWILSTLDSN